MKKLFFFLLFLIPSLLFAQKQVILRNGLIINEEIKSFFGDELFFFKKVEATGTDKVKIADVYQINGKIPEYRRRAIIKKNPAVMFNQNLQDEKIQLNIDNKISQPPLITGTNLKMPGDFLKSAGSLYLAGEILAVIGTGITFAAISDFENVNSEMLVAGSLATLAGGVCVIVGHVQLLKAGKALNNASLSLGATSSGVGLTFKF
jgi:hypothetical protein